MRSVTVRGVRRAFSGVEVLHGVDIVAEAGEHLALLGPSGSGKSTLLRLIAGLDAPDSGDILFDDESQLPLGPHQRDVAMVFQQYALYPHLSVLNNISTGLRFGKRMTRADAEQRARDVAGAVGLEAYVARKPKELSGGQRQRVALARALARRSGTVLLDEPLSGLDAQLRMSVRTEIFARLRATGATVIHVTHDQSDALAGADRIAVIDNGEIRQVGTPLELYRAPHDLFVAQFLGVPQMNVFAVTQGLARGGGRSPFGVHRGVGTTEPVWMGVRPENIVLGDARGWSLRGTVSSTELNGADYLVHLSVGDEIVTFRHVGTPPVPGETLTASVNPADVLVFQGEAQRRSGTGAELPVEDTPSRIDERRGDDDRA